MVLKELIMGLGSLNKGSVEIAGGKGAQLGELMSLGVNVPNGFVVLTHSFELFLDQNVLRAKILGQLKKADVDNTSSVEKASESIRVLIAGAKMPSEVEENILGEFDKLNTKFVAVRSSATAEDAGNASWAGELDTYTNQIRGALLNAVKNCWSSLFTPRAIFYRKEKNIEENISMGIVVQKMVDSEVSGVAFSIHPVSKDGNQVMIEAGFGLGESIVSGAITPDTYIVNKKEMFIEEIRVNKQEKMFTRENGKTVEAKVLEKIQEEQKLDGEKIIELAEIVKKIEQHYGFPQDIEWAVANNEIFILQSRPVTA